MLKMGETMQCGDNGPLGQEKKERGDKKWAKRVIRRPELRTGSEK